MIYGLLGFIRGNSVVDGIWTPTVTIVVDLCRVKSMGPMGPMADGHLLGKYGQTNKSGWNQQASRQTSHLQVLKSNRSYGAIVLRKSKSVFSQSGYGSIPINTIFRGMNIHLPAILMFTRCQGFDPSPSVHKLSMFCAWPNDRPGDSYNR